MRKRVLFRRSCFQIKQEKYILEKCFLHPAPNWKQLAMLCTSLQPRFDNSDNSPGFRVISSPTLGEKCKINQLNIITKPKEGPFFSPPHHALSLFLKDVHSRYTRRCPTAPFSLCQQTQADDRSTQRSSVLWYFYLCSQRLIIIEIPRGWKISVMKRCWMNVCGY